MSNLSTDAILQRMADALPTHPAGDDSSDIASSYEVVALLVHAYLTALDFRLIGFQEDNNLPECQSLAPRLPASWNTGFGTLSFVYKHKQSALSFIFRIDRMGAKVEIRGLAAGAETIYRFERLTRDVVSSSALPLRITLNNGQEDRSDLPARLRAAFTSTEAIEGILTDLREQIVQRLIPRLQQEGYTETETRDAEQQATQERRDQEARGPNRPFAGDPSRGIYPQPGPLPDAARPRPPVPMGDFPPPGFDDEYDMNRPPGAGGALRMPGRSPFNIGHDDLHPPGLGPHDPLRPSFIPGVGGLGGPGGSGMHPTFDDPLFGGQGGGGFPGSGDGYHPQAPPGARWDPLGPGGGPRPGRGGGGPFGGNTFGGSNPFGGGGDII